MHPNETANNSPWVRRRAIEWRASPAFLVLLVTVPLDLGQISQLAFTFINLTVRLHLHGPIISIIKEMAVRIGGVSKRGDAALRLLITLRNC